MNFKKSKFRCQQLPLFERRLVEVSLKDKIEPKFWQCKWMMMMIFDFFLWGSFNPILYASAMMHDVQDCK